MDISLSSSLFCSSFFIISIDYNHNIWRICKNDNYIPKQIDNLFDIKSISCCVYHCICCDYNGNVYTFGANNNGMGTGELEEEIVSFKPCKINISSISQVSCGFDFNIYLSYSGELYSSGRNTYGELGLGHRNSVLQTELIPNISNVTFVECASRSVICKTNDNLYYSWGYGLFGQLIQGHSNTCLIPTLCKNIPDNVISIRSGTYHVLLLTIEGLVYGCGSNSNGQLGIKKKAGTNFSKPTLISSLPPIKKISCGYNHSMCIDTDNNLWVFGYNEYGQLGLGHTTSAFTPKKTFSDIMDISYGGDVTFIKTFDSKIYAFGSNERSLLSQETTHDIKTKKEMLQGYEDIWGIKNISNRKKSARK